jgi:hypothetical protein
VWGIDQYSLGKKRFSVALYHLLPATRERHPFAGQATAEYLHDLLQRYPSLELLDTTVNVDSYESGFREARSFGSDYFLMLHIEESERSFTAVLDMYLTATGKLLQSYRVFRTGNDRVQDNFNILAERFFGALPLRGTLLSRQFNRGVIDLGKREELEPGQELSIVKKGKVRLENSKIGLTTSREDVLGTFTVTAVDENISEGTVQKRSFFDLINSGDEIIGLEPEPPPAQIEEGEPGLLRRLLSFIGR